MLSVDPRNVDALTTHFSGLNAFCRRPNLGSGLPAQPRTVTPLNFRKETKTSLKEYKPGQAFSGVIGRTFDVSQPAWPAPNRARDGAANVLFIVLDDTGFGQLGCYGSPINTPHIDALAADGLRYNKLHTTALCST